jgi:hypothetical protein
VCDGRHGKGGAQISPLKLVAFHHVRQFAIDSVRPTIQKTKDAVASRAQLHDVSRREPVGPVMRPGTWTIIHSVVASCDVCVTKWARWLGWGLQAPRAQWRLHSLASTLCSSSGKWNRHVISMDAAGPPSGTHTQLVPQSPDSFHSIFHGNEHGSECWGFHGQLPLWKPHQWCWVQTHKETSAQLSDQLIASMVKINVKHISTSLCLTPCKHQSEQSVTAAAGCWRNTTHKQLLKIKVALASSVC